MTTENKIQNKHWSELYLTITEGENKGARFPLQDGENILGRAGGIRLEGEGISRQHSSIAVDEEVQLEDLGSTSGTMLNSRMLVGKDFIFDGDEIRLGSVALRLSAKRRENRAGVLGGYLAVVIGLVLLVAGFFLQDYLRTIWRERNAQKRSQEEEVATPAWYDWNNFDYPSVAELSDENIPITPASANTEFNLGMQLFSDRMLDPGNSHQAIIHFKRALGIAENVAAEERPAIMNRAVTHLAELQRSIADNCNTKVFAFVRAQQMRYTSGMYDALDQIVRYVPNVNDPYHKWARMQIARLDMQFRN